MNDMTTEELRRRNLGLLATEPYKPGQQDISAEMFDRKLLPMCLECGKVTVDYFIYQGVVDLEFWCDDACEERYRRRREKEKDQQAREQKAYLDSMRGAL